MASTARIAHGARFRPGHSRGPPPNGKRPYRKPLEKVVGLPPRSRVSAAITAVVDFEREVIFFEPLATRPDALAAGLRLVLFDGGERLLAIFGVFHAAGKSPAFARPAAISCRAHERQEGAPISRVLSTAPSIYPACACSPARSLR